MRSFGVSYIPRSEANKKRGFLLSRDNYIPAEESLLRKVTAPEPNAWYYEFLVNHGKEQKAKKLLANFKDESFQEYSDQFISKRIALSLQNFDLNMSFFEKLNYNEYKQHIEKVCKAHHLCEIHDLSKVTWNGMYVMCLGEYKQVFVGYTSRSIKDAVKFHWTTQKPLDRLIFLNKYTSILSVDSFLMLDTTRIFVKRKAHISEVGKVLSDLDPKYTLNRLARDRFDDLPLIPNAARKRNLSGVDIDLNVKEQFFFASLGCLPDVW